MSRFQSRKVPTKKLLVAAVGVATVNYAAGCGGIDTSQHPSGNLMAPLSSSTSTSTSSSGPLYTTANLMAPSSSSQVFYTAGNLMAPSSSTSTSSSTTRADAGDGGGTADGGDAATVDGDIVDAAAGGGD
jgi:hypothetical protein